MEDFEVMNKEQLVKFLKMKDVKELNNWLWKKKSRIEGIYKKGKFEYWVDKQKLLNSLKKF